MVDIALQAGVTDELSLVGYHGNVERGHIPCLVDVVLPVCAVIIDPATGKLALADASAAPTARCYGIALRTQKAGWGGLTLVRFGIIDGLDLDALDFDDPVFLSDTAGRLADGAGTVSVPVGRVVPGTGAIPGQTYHKMLEVELV